MNLPKWLDEAACLKSDPSLFFPEREEMDATSYRQAVLEAKDVCASCSKTRECADFAVRQGIVYGIFGGMLPEERARWAKKQRVPKENLELFV